jgi:NAD(P)-dependent dehydrogenase (short-subunit alcohol dehydrogenase family)|tara:strand:+ start:336 stop:1202 length:867 start_codon:yes stop_codon:yes gene_type:complete
MKKKKTIIITGASQGLGLEISKSLLLADYNIAICSKNNRRLIKAYNYLLNFKKKDQKIFFKSLDISNQKQVASFIKLSILKFGKIYGIVNNAGILGPIGKFEKLDIKKWKKTIDVNLYGSLYTILSLIPHFKKNKKGKIIQLSGSGALSPMQNFTAYSASKAAIVRFADTIALELKDYNIQINSIAAGPINTKILDEIIKTGAKKVGNLYYKNIQKQKENGGLPLVKVTELVSYLLEDESKFINGKIISPKWDNWEKWKKNKKFFKNTEVFTLRRLKGKDRNYSKGDK